MKQLAPKWMTLVLRAAGVYNLLWGAFTVVWPNLYFEWLDMPGMNYPMMWQGVGMIVGVYGIGYWIAAKHPEVHWPIVFVGFLGKLFGPIGMAGYVADGTLPLRMMIMNIGNDLVWLLPFAGILLWAYQFQKAQASKG
jgi:small multidrug resistance pump